MKRQGCTAVQGVTNYKGQEALKGKQILATKAVLDWPLDTNADTFKHVLCVGKSVHDAHDTAA